MKTLLLIRHAHASLRNGNAMQDHERPLSTEGRESALKVAMVLKHKISCPDLLISSPAVRAFDTAVIMAEAMNYPRHEILVESKIYDGNTEDLFSTIVALPNDLDTVMITGHNPAITQLANSMMSRKIDYMPNTGVVCLEFAVEAWEEIPLAKGKMAFILGSGL